MPTIVATTACGGGGQAGEDAATARNNRLVVLDPPGESIGLAFGASMDLRVRYETETGEPIVGQPVAFTMSSATGNTGGSSLSAIEGITDASGVAIVELTSGAEQVNFQVEASASDAPSANFYVGVSDTGFAELVATPAHLGWRPADVFNRIEVRLYPAADLRCRDLDPGAPPDSPFPPRTLAEFGDNVTYQSVIAYMPYTLVGWAIGPDDATRLAIGCVDLEPEIIPPQRLELELLIRDRLPRWPASIELHSQLDLTGVNTAVADTPSERLWRILDCPAGLGQALLDCAMDATVSDGNYDCVVNGTSAALTAIESKRGAADIDGCRPEMLPGPTPSIDKLLTDAVASGGTFPTGGALATLLQQRRDVLASVNIDSLMIFDTPGIATHRLVTATVGSGASTLVVDLVASNRPVIQQTQVAYGLNASREVGVGQHGYTLRLGSLARDGFEHVGLAPAGLGGKGAQLGEEMMASVSDGMSGTTGCEAISNIACNTAGQASACLQSMCAQAQSALDAGLAAWWSQLNGSELDLTLLGTAPVRDDDYNLIIDRVGTDPGEGGPGAWQATIELADGTPVNVPGAFSSAKPVP